MTHRLEGIEWLPEATNTVEIISTFGVLGLDHVTVSTADDLAAAYPHRRVLDASPAAQASLLTYLRSLDGTAEALPDPLAPVPAFALAAGQAEPLEAPYVDIEVTFSSPVLNLSVEDFDFGGTTSASHATVTAITPGSHYRLRLAGLSGAGTLTVALPATALTGSVAGLASEASLPFALTYAPPLIEDLASLSDEFDDPSTLALWQRNNTLEGWDADKLEVIDIDTTTPGHLHLMPVASSWYQDITGAFAFREVTGDFVATTDLTVNRRGQAGRPNSDYSLAGLMVRADRGVRAAAPQPDPGTGMTLAVPPPAEGQPGHYTTDWAPGTENYVTLTFGYANSVVNGDPNVWQYQVTSTTDGVAQLYPRSYDVPSGEDRATLQIVRRGTTFLLLRRHGDGPWIIENRFDRPDLPATLQIGLMVSTDWNTVSADWDFENPTIPYHQNRLSRLGEGQPDLVARVDYFRLRRPDLDLSPANLADLIVTGPNGPVQPLAGTPVAPWLGNPAAAPASPPTFTYGVWLGQYLTATQLADPALTAPAADLDRDRLPNVLDLLIDGDPFGGDAALLPQIVMVEQNGHLVPHLTVGRNPAARGWRLTIESSADLVNWTIVATSEDGAAPTGPGFIDETSAAHPVMLFGPPEDEGDTPAPLRTYRLRATALGTP